MTTGRGKTVGSLIPPPPPPSVAPAPDGAAAVAWAAWVAVGAATALTGLGPTGGQITDLVLVTGCVALAGRATRRTPLWLTVIVTGLFSAYSLGAWTIAAIGIALTLFAAAVEYRQRSTPLLTAAFATATLGVSAWLPGHDRFGVSSAVGLVGCGVLVAGGLKRERSQVRRRYVYGAVFATEIAMALTGFALYRLVRVRDDLAIVNDQMRIAVDSFSIAEPDSAGALLDEAAANVREVGERIDSPWLRGAEVVPVVAQHVRAARILATRTGPVLQSVADATEVLRPDRLAISNGRVDLAAMAEMGSTARHLADQVASLRRAVDRASTGWLVSRLHDPIERIRPDLRHVDDLATGMADLFDQAPAMLGEGTPRRYFVAFITPSEARGLGGYLGNYAILEAADGAIEMTTFGRSIDLITASRARSDDLRLTEPTGYLERYQRYGVGGGDASTPPWWWQQITVSPDMPSVGTVIADLYEQSTGDAIDGVISLDPAAIEALISATGDVDIGSDLPPVGVLNVREFLLRTQYIEFGDRLTEERTDALETVARVTVDRLLDLGTLPAETLRRLGDAIAERHLMVWSAVADEQATLVRTGVSGGFALDPQDSVDSVMVVSQNGGPNKLDAFQQRTVRYDGVLGDDGVLRATVTVELENRVPSLDLRPEVIGNLFDEPIGVNRGVVTVYHSGPVVALAADGSPAEVLASDREAGWEFEEQLVRVPPSAAITLRFDTATRIEDRSHLAIELWAQPVANPDVYSVRVATPDGRLLIDRSGTLSRTTRFNLDQN